MIRSKVSACSVEKLKVLLVHVSMLERSYSKIGMEFIICYRVQVEFERIHLSKYTGTRRSTSSSNKKRRRLFVLVGYLVRLGFGSNCSTKRASEGRAASLKRICNCRLVGGSIKYCLEHFRGILFLCCFYLHLNLSWWRSLFFFFLHHHVGRGARGRRCGLDLIFRYHLERCRWWW